jgi:hypothetical protein
VTSPFGLARLQAALEAMDTAAPPLAQLRELVAQGLDELPLPASGCTLLRWQALARVGAHDQSLAKLYEGHTDALAILAELGCAPLRPPGSTWGTWAAEAPDGRAELRGMDGVQARLHGAKSWCSGADGVTHGLLTAWLPDGSGPQLAALDMRQRGVAVSASRWHAVGMSRSTSLDLRFEGAAVDLVGEPGGYLERAGFWHGGTGIAACWYGGAVTLADALGRGVGRGEAPATGFRLAALGRTDVCLRQTRAVLREAAQWIDAHPGADARAIALRARLCAEACATEVLQAVGSALGAGPFCREERFARCAADLPVFIRQSHAERDFAALGERIASGVPAWDL